MTTSPYIRGDGPGHNPITEPPPVSDCQGNGWVVCTTITLSTGAIIKRRVNPLQWGIMRSLGYIEEIVPQGNLDNLAWELGSTVVADPIVTPPDPPPVIVAPMDAGHKEIALELVSTAENSTLNWTSSYGYIEDIGDGRGYTAGICGFCSGTHDMLALVEYHCLTTPGNALQPFLPALRAVDGTASHAGLGAPFVAAWKSESTTAAFRAAQRRERDRVYFNPAVAQAVADGLHALGQHCYFDASILNGPEGRQVIRTNARKVAKTPTDGGSETAYLKAWCDSAVAYMLQDPAHSVTDRIDKCQRKFLNEGKLTLDPPLTWTMYGDQFTIATIPATPTDPVDPPPVEPPLPPPVVTGKDPWRSNPIMFWNRRLPTSTPKSPHSDAYRARFVAYLRNNVNTAYGVPESVWPNTNGFTCPIYVVGADTPKVMVDYGGGWHGSTPGGIRTIDAEVTAALNAGGGIRIPVGAKVSPAADHEMAVYDTTTDTLYEFWCMLEPHQTVHDIESGIGPSTQINPTGRYQTMTAGVMHDFAKLGTGRYIDTPGYAQKLWGTAATGLTYTGGRITVQDMIDGVIPHAIDMAIPFNMHANDRCWPAWRNDWGDQPIESAPPEGMRLRLPASFNPAGIGNEFARMVATAMRDYGIIINDTSGKASIRFDSSIGFTSMGQPDPWPALFAVRGVAYAPVSDGLEMTYQSQRNVRVALSQIPWEIIEYLPAGWGQ